MFIFLSFSLLLVLVVLFLIFFLLRGAVKVPTGHIGIIEKKWSFRRVPVENSFIFSVEGEPGIFANTLAPGLHLGFPLFIYKIHVVPLTEVSPGQIALVSARDGRSSENQPLGMYVECNDFQDGKAFLVNGGRKGRQMHLLRSGSYAINTMLFDVIKKHSSEAAQLNETYVPEGFIGLVTTTCGEKREANRIAGPIVSGHDSFQNPNKFVEQGGTRGFQEEFITDGTWCLNPWFVSVELAPLVNIPESAVGVVVSHIGTDSQKGRNELVESGHIGIQRVPLACGKRAMNTKTHDIIIVPTHEIKIEWNDEDKATNRYDASLRSITVNSFDTFTFKISVTQIISIPPENAPLMVTRVGRLHQSDEGSIQEVESKHSAIYGLVDRVLVKLVEETFQNIAQNYDALQFKLKREKIQGDVAKSIRESLQAYGVNSIGTFINNIDLPKEVQAIRTKGQLYEQELEAEEAKLQLEKKKAETKAEEALANQKQKLIEAETAAKVSQIKAENEAEVEKIKAKNAVEVAGQRSKERLIDAQSHGEATVVQGEADAKVTKAMTIAEGGVDAIIRKTLAANIHKVQLPTVLSVSGESNQNTLDSLIPSFLAMKYVGNELDHSGKKLEELVSEEDMKNFVEENEPNILELMSKDAESVS